MPTGVLHDLIRHAAARAILARPDSTPEQRDEARATLGMESPIQAATRAISPLLDRIRSLPDEAA